MAGHSKERLMDTRRRREESCQEWTSYFSGANAESRNRPGYGFQEMAHTLLLAEDRLQDGVEKGVYGRVSKRRHSLAAARQLDGASDAVKSETTIELLRQDCSSTSGLWLPGGYSLMSGIMRTACEDPWSWKVHSDRTIWRRCAASMQGGSNSFAIGLRLHYKKSCKQRCLPLRLLLITSSMLRTQPFWAWCTPAAEGRVLCHWCCEVLRTGKSHVITAVIQQRCHDGLRVPLCTPTRVLTQQYREYLRPGQFAVDTLLGSMS